jgi:branched-chain amino acid aminotransferase
MTKILLPFWLDGAFRHEEKMRLDPADRGFTLGDGAFETMAVFNGIVVDQTRHLDRLMQASETLALRLDRKALEAAIRTLITAHQGVHGILRVTTSRGAGGRGLAAATDHPSILMTVSPWTKGTLNQKAALATSRIRRNETSPASRLKLTSYADNVLAAREAAAANCDDALLLNGRGHVACTTIANVVAAIDGSLFIPPPEDGALPGIVAGQLGATPRHLTPDDLHRADGVFLTNSLRLIRPVTSLDGKLLSRKADGLIEKVFDVLCRKIAATCGIDPRIVDGL